MKSSRSNTKHPRFYRSQAFSSNPLSSTPPSSPTRHGIADARSPHLPVKSSVASKGIFIVLSFVELFSVFGKKMATLLGYSKRLFYLLARVFLSRRIVIVVLALLVLSQFFKSIVHLTASATQMFPLQTIDVEGDVSLSMKEKVRQHPHLKTLIENGRSLISIDTQLVAQELDTLKQLKTVAVSKRYPSTLVVNLAEREDLVLLSHQGKVRAFTLGKEEVPVDSNLNYNHFWIEVEANDQIAERVVKQLISSLAKLPAEEKDFFRLFSNMYYSNGQLKLFSISSYSDAQLPVEIRWVGELNLQKLRQARFAYLYFLSNQPLQQTSDTDKFLWKVIDITASLTRFTNAND